MNWVDVLQDKSLQDLPYEIETNQYGQIVMSPVSNRHRVFQGRIFCRLGALTTLGAIMPECAVQTSRGVKVADVAWASAEFIATQEEQLAYNASPELCVEVLSPSNRALEIEEKTALYFEHGASEVWICDDNGQMRFLNPAREIELSGLFPAFPGQV